MLNDIWILTSYFNPCRYQTKKVNFDMFAARLKSIGANLLLVEMAIDDGEFELGDDHDVIRLRGDGVMWQKERLLNIAVANLPASCTKVVWLDADVLFEDEDWLRKTADALEHYVVVQPFSNCVRLPRGHVQWPCDAEEEAIAESFAAMFARDRSLAHNARYDQHGHTGFAWAARRDLLDACGLYDACLTGTSDHLMAHVFAGALDSRCIPLTLGVANAHAAHFSRWAAGADEMVGSSLGYVEGRVLHLWHGAVADRRYYWRNQEFKTFDFDPDRHLRLAANGLWEWGDAPAEMRLWASDLFVSRNEDGDRALLSQSGP